MSLYPSTITLMSTERMKNLKKICITYYKSALSYSYNSRWFGKTVNQPFLKILFLLMVPPSIRINKNYRAMAALVLLQRGSHILTLTSLSLCAMRPVWAVNTVLVWYHFHTKNQKDAFDHRDTSYHSWKIGTMHTKNSLIPLHEYTHVLLLKS
jgi:hypothetical protein